MQAGRRGHVPSMMPCDASAPDDARRTAAATLPAAAVHAGAVKQGEDELVLVVGVDHPLAKSEQISATDLTTLPLVVRGAGSASQRCVDEALEEAGVHRDQLVTWMETNSVDATRSAVTCGLAAAFLSRRGIAGDLESGRLCHVRVKRVRPRRQLYLVTAVDRVVGTPLREFLEFVESQ